jgi:hypothetical protein
MAYHGVELIAEVKTDSPFGFKSERSWEELFEVANEIGDMFSIHTDPRWGGSFELVRRARTLTKKPILAKGIHVSNDDIKRALDAGADLVLVVGRMPLVHLEQCILEPISLRELGTYPPDVRVLWNTRDLSNGMAKKETFIQARRAFSGWLCQGSFIKVPSDIDPTADAALIGTELTAFAQALKE